ncbi:Uncharacterized conserved protein, contains GH25 family domain [Desulfocicer vacuolatum DSM 3385]|uniref:Uncharacterized conserved protein, contains GH25 family domain n=1 Tax=Desulfocicer vacuolatum DSM 3385 TaxID=1121400 RepID=A0A1W1YTC8_9BACT|nr:DUF4198 domain-containing protein [Desulfocicer vacuolatum]SMC39061.1 Uncharacterized conserved protein, contains GH25 family domain [Desulfocicer vacuolatum DSM 3385]
MTINRKGHWIQFAWNGLTIQQLPGRIKLLEILFVAILLLGNMLSPSNTSAHSLYIQSSRYDVKEGKSFPLFFCYGHHIPVSDGLRAKKIKSIQIHTPTGEVRDISVRDETSLHSYLVEYENKGTYALTAQTTPGYYTIYVDKKGREHHVIKPQSKIKDKAKEIKLSLYSRQFTKSYVTCEASSTPFPANVGLPLELVPEKDLNNLKVGEDLVLQVYFNGKPFTGSGTWDATYNGFSSLAEDHYYPGKEINGDTIKMFVSNPGRWFVRYFIKVNAPPEEKEKCSQLKYTATLVFEIPNERMRQKKTSH